jgi:hypothetical protein
MIRLFLNINVKIRQIKHNTSPADDNTYRRTIRAVWKWEMILSGVPSGGTPEGNTTFKLKPLMKVTLLLVDLAICLVLSKDTQYNSCNE